MATHTPQEHPLDLGDPDPALVTNRPGPALRGSMRALGKKGLCVHRNETAHVSARRGAHNQHVSDGVSVSRSEP